MEAQARATSRDAARGDGHRRGRRADRIQHLGVPDALREEQRAVLRRALASLRMVGVRAAINGWTEFAKEHRRVWAVLRRAGGALMHVSVRRAFNGWIARAEEKHQTRATMLWAATALSNQDVRRCMNHWVARVQAAHAELLSSQAWHRSYEEVWHAQPVEAEERTFKETLSYWQAAAERRSRDEWHARRVRTGDCLAEHTKSDTLFTAGGGEGHEKAITLYSLSTGAVKGALQGHAEDVRCVTCDGDTVASGDAGGIICLWSLKAGQMSASFEGSHSHRPVNAICLKGDTLATGGQDQAVRAWSIRKQVVLCEMREHTNSVTVHIGRATSQRERRHDGEGVAPAGQLQEPRDAAAPGPRPFGGSLPPDGHYGLRRRPAPSVVAHDVPVHALALPRVRRGAERAHPRRLCRQR